MLDLNNRCLQGPDLTYKLVDGVLRCWQSSYAADVECMYMQDKIPEKDCNMLRFFWYKGSFSNCGPVFVFE